MNTPNISRSSKGTMGIVPYASGSGRREMSVTPDVSGSIKGEAWGRFNTSGSRGTESWDRHSASESRRGEMLEIQYGYTGPRKTTAEGTRHTSDTSQQPSAYGDQTYNMKEIFKMIKEMEDKNKQEMFERMKEMDNKNRKEIFEMMKEMDNKIIALSERVIQILPNTNKEKEENEKLKEMIEKLKARNQHLLSNAMAMHQQFEDINDPSHLSAVLERYEILRLREWEKVRNSCRWTYAEGSRIIRKLFDACEKDTQQRTDNILKALNIPCENALTKVMKQHIMKLLRQHYNKNSTELNNRIVQEADIHTGTENAERFLQQCCKIYCLLLLQDSPVKAEWETNTMDLEHVDKKDFLYWGETSLLWPIMKRGEEIIVKGVVWDQGKMF